MNTISSWWNTNKPTKRRLIQLYSALLYNANLKGFVNGQIYTGKTKALCTPGFNCYSCPGAVGACPLGSLQASLAASDKQAGFYIIGIFLLYGLIAGRTICGWACPLGLIQELLHKIPTPKIKKSRVTRALTYLKYIFLAVFVVAVTLWYGLKHSMAVPGFCKYICPAGTFEGAMGLLSNPNNAHYFGMLGILFTRKFIIMLVIGLLCIFCYRAFCRFICPLGALYGMFNQLALIGIKVDMGKCNGCGACVRNCKMDVRRVGDHECIHCGHCMAGCAQGAISMKAGKFTLMEKKGGSNSSGEVSGEDRERLKRTDKKAWTAALIVLAAALLWYNVIDNKDTVKKETDNTSNKIEDISKTPYENPVETDVDLVTGYEEDYSQRYVSDAPVGYNVGEQLEDFTATCIDGSVFRLSDQKGKVVVINLWATWCGPCVQELPHFYEFYHEHGDDVAVLTCHSRYGEHDDVYEDVKDFFKDKDWDTPVAIDDDENGIFEKTNGSTTLPQTIVLNRKGEVIYNEIRSITPQMLEKLYEKATMGEEAGEYKKYLSEASQSAGDTDEILIDAVETSVENDGEEEVPEDEASEEVTEDEPEEALEEEPEEVLQEEPAEDSSENVLTEEPSEDELAQDSSNSDPAKDIPALVVNETNKTDKLTFNVNYDAANRRLTISGNSVKKLLNDNDLKSKEDFVELIRKYNRIKKKTMKSKGK